MSDKETRLLLQFFSIMDKHHNFAEGYLQDAWKKYKSKYGKPEKIKANKPIDLQEVIAYFKELKIVDPLKNAEKFYNHYEAVNWVRGKAKIVNWKACVKTWNFDKEATKKIGINLSEYSKRTG